MSASAKIITESAPHRKTRSVRVSFEFFPPRDEKMEANLWRALDQLARFAPDFVSVTYGAGGSVRARTQNLVLKILRETDFVPAAHLTCVGESRAELEEHAKTYWQAGVQRLVVLRGDMPDMAAPYRAHPKGFQSTPEFIAALRQLAPFDISISAYPETHPDSPSPEDDLALMQRKIEAGGKRAITQFAFDNDSHIRLRERARAAGITVPIIPGIMPTTNFAGLCRMAQKCGATIPSWLAQAYDGLEDDLAARKETAHTVALRQCEELVREGFDRLHFYTLNQAGVAASVCESLGLAVQK